ncbi:T9SS type A sorting domain-containing protein [Flavitalea sp. BT771]|uniref:T9SS type A sorting domain-containing protein n=1 Tax=Flavitalea sp. BT771 TaxID=3063329 RepID=UPI0026E125E3|nr:T9SS type A sorting domain-containing protein [Flavitalea sp. BT771]MDO6434812.1 T9SS type A sorting domain-containing protein [Flavitalea sp. BT771]MDV6223712.1 T9SS type A sorting domain-containing protein [Flavitalea sp. BT771]
MNLRIILPIAAFLAGTMLSSAQPAYSPAPSPPPQVTAIEWFIDTDPGFGNATPLPHTDAPDITSLMATIPLASISHGVHQLFIRSKDASGSWSLTAAGTFENLHPPYSPNASAPAPITQLEVFFDNDPGFGNGIKRSVSAGTDISNLSLTLGIDTLSKGPHRLFIRTPGSLTASAGFANDVPLPLTWLYAKGEIIDGQSHLTWATAEEHNTKSFEIEHSLDGHAYTSIGATPAAGNSAQQKEYAWIHTHPASGANYYRIKQVDLDNKFTYSSIVPLFYTPSLFMTTAIPNPFTSSLTVVLATPADRSLLTIYNTAGIPLFKTQLPDGTRQQYLDLSSLPAGVYFLQLQSGTHLEILRILKKPQG